MVGKALKVSCRQYYLMRGVDMYLSGAWGTHFQTVHFAINNGRRPRITMKCHAFIGGERVEIWRLA